jgi:glycosyltransferase involved in cell wall biosynthesis
MRRKFIEGGYAAEKLYVKPNFLDPDPQLGQGGGKFALYAGRLAKEKGIATLLKTWEQVGPKLQLKIAGAGPLEPMVREAASRTKSIVYLGLQSSSEVLRLMGEATLFMMPTEFYEGHPRSTVEAFARGLPVIGSRIGALVEMVEDGKSGILFNPGDAQDLASKLNWALCHPERLVQIGKEARHEFEEKYTAERNYKMLMDIYQSAIKSRRGGGG